MFLNHYPKLHETLMHKFLIGTYLYLSNPDFMHEVHQRIMFHIHPTKDHIIVAHSLGTVIAYNLLHQFTNFRVHRFITLGSPLAFKVIQEKLNLPISRPPQLHGDWFNFYSPDDFLTTFPLSEAPFNFKPPIINQAITTLIHNPHQITGYLQHPAVIKSIVDALLLKKQTKSKYISHICFIFIHLTLFSKIILEKSLTAFHIHPIIRPPLKRPYRLEA